MIDKNELCELIRKVYPDIGVCGIDMEVDFDARDGRWAVKLKKAGKELKVLLEPGEAELCLEGTKCLDFVMQINELKDLADSMDRTS